MQEHIVRGLPQAAAQGSARVQAHQTGVLSIWLSAVAAACSTVSLDPPEVLATVQVTPATLADTFTRTTSPTEPAATLNPRVRLEAL